jgi:hypothetical protein
MIGRTSAQTIAAVAIAAGAGLVAVALTPARAPKPAPDPLLSPAESSMPKTIGVIPIRHETPAPAPTASPIDDALRQLAEQVLAGPVAAAVSPPSEPDAPASSSAPRAPERHVDICARNGGKRVDYMQGRRSMWRCEFPQRTAKR